MTKNYLPKFKEEKAIAAASLLLQLSGGACDKYWLNKVMYYIERESLIQSGQPMFNDSLISIQYGPIVSAVNDAIDNAAYPYKSEWNKHITLEDKTVKLLEVADSDVLSEFDEEIITNAYHKFKGWSFSRLKNFFHGLPEYKETKSPVDIEYSDILRKAGIDEESIKDALDNLAYLDFLGC
jgi:uncharacterized phage-associated protein